MDQQLRRRRRARAGVLAGGAVAAAALLTAAAVVLHLASDPVVQDCVSATAAVDAANTAHQDAMGLLDNRFRRGGKPADVARLQVERTKDELAAARAAFQLACHYEADGR